MFWIFYCHFQWIAKDCGSFRKAYAMFLFIRRSLILIPLEFNHPTLRWKT